MYNLLDRKIQEQDESGEEKKSKKESRCWLF